MMKDCDAVMRSFINAALGIRRVLAERNMRIHLAAGAVVAVIGFMVGLSAGEWLAILFVSGGVMAAEAFNTAIEILSDRVCPEYDPAIKQVKDVAAAAVLIWAIVAVITGAVILLPEIIAIIS